MFGRGMDRALAIHVLLSSERPLTEERDPEKVRCSSNPARGQPHPGGSAAVIILDRYAAPYENSVLVAA